MMSFVPFIDEATTLARSLCDICLAAAFIGCVLMLFELGFVLGFGARGRAAGGTQPPVTVLKPLHGAEPELTGRLAAFCRQDYEGPIQVLCGAREMNAPAANAVRTMQREHPDWPIELHVDPRRYGSNRKVSNLINMFPHVRHDTLILSDSDIVVDQTYLRDIAALLAQPRAGAVTTLYHGIAGEGLWARMSALAINTNFLPQAITALALKAAKPCFGATIALRRSMLEKIGGFGQFADELADDYAIGMAVRSAGYDVVIAPFLVGHVCFETSLRQFIRHQILRRPHRQDHRPDRLCGHDPDPSLAAGAHRHALRHRRCGPVGGGRTGIAHRFVPMRRTAVRTEAGKLLARPAAGHPCFRRICSKLFRGDGPLAGRRVPRGDGRHPD